MMTRELVNERFDANAWDDDLRERVRDVARSLFGIDDARVERAVAQFDTLMRDMPDDMTYRDIVRDDLIDAITQLA